METVVLTDGRGINLRREHAIAKVLGVMPGKGWRKRIQGAQLTEYQVEQVNRVVAGLNGLSRVKRINRMAKPGCPYDLHPESEVTGELFYLLKSNGVNVKMEVSVPSNQHCSGFMRADLGIFDRNGELKQVVECKRWGKQLRADTRQAKAYLALMDRFKVWVHFVNDRSHFQKVLDAALAI
jgi:hypothetical protein